MYKVTSKNNVITTNDSIIADGYGSITLKNIGTDAAIINDNIPLAAGASFVWENMPNVVIDENISIRFAYSGVLTQKLLVIKYYFKEV